MDQCVEEDDGVERAGREVQLGGDEDELAGALDLDVTDVHTPVTPRPTAARCRAAETPQSHPSRTCPQPGRRSCGPAGTQPGPREGVLMAAVAAE